MRRLLLTLIACAAWPLRAQMDMQHSMEMNEGPLGIPESRMGSGTSWLPDASPMHAAHMVLGDWTLMLHGNGFAQYDWQGGPRGSNQLGFVNWAMAAASRLLGGGRLELRGMLSAEPWTVGSRGYPLLLQSGESYRERRCTIASTRTTSSWSSPRCTSGLWAGISGSPSISLRWASRRWGRSPFRTGPPPPTIRSPRSPITGRTARTSPSGS